MPANKKFPPPRAKEAVAPYRKAAPAPPPLSNDVKSAPIVELPQRYDLLEELQKVEIDPRVLEEARSSNRSWGSVMIAFGLFLIIISIALDVSMWNTGYVQWRFFSMPGMGVILVAYGIRKWRQRGINY
jgi:hypothetical protein